MFILEKKGDACHDDFDGDGEKDDTDYCPENSNFKATDMNALGSVSLTSRM